MPNNASSTWPAGMSQEEGELRVRIGDLEAFHQTDTPEYEKAVADLAKLTKES